MGTTGTPWTTGVFPPNNDFLRDSHFKESTMAILGVAIQDRWCHEQSPPAREPMDFWVHNQNALHRRWGTVWRHGVPRKFDGSSWFPHMGSYFFFNGGSSSHHGFLSTKAWFHYLDDLGYLHFRKSPYVLIKVITWSITFSDTPRRTSLNFVVFHCFKIVSCSVLKMWCLTWGSKLTSMFFRGWLVQHQPNMICVHGCK